MTKITNTSKNDPIINLVAAMGDNGCGILQQESIGQRELCQSMQLPTKLSDYDKSGKAIEIYKKLGFEVGEIDKHDPLFVEVKMPKGWKKQATDHSMWSDLLDDKGRKRASIFYKAAFYDRSAFISFNTRFSISMIKWLPDEKKYKTETYRYVEVQEVSEPNPYWSDRVIFQDDNEIVIESMDGMINKIIKGKPKRITKTGTRKVSVFKDLYEETNNTPYFAKVLDGDEQIFCTRRKKFKLVYTGQGNDYAHRAWWREHDRFEKNVRRKAINYLNKNYPNWQSIYAYWD